MDLSVVIVSYNCRTFVNGCLVALRPTSNLQQEVIVVDNSSSDGTAEQIAADHPSVRLFHMGENVGFGAASNFGMQEAVGRYLLLLNPDTITRPRDLRVLVAFLDRNPRAGVVAPRLVYPDGSDQRTARAFPTVAAGLFGRRSLLTKWFPDNRWSRRYLSGRSKSTSEPFRVDWVSGACLLARREIFVETGGFDADFFMHWEDAEWCYRIKKLGYEVWCEPRSVVVHYEGGSRRGWPPSQIWEFHRGALLFWRKTHTGLPAKILGIGVGAALYSRAAVLVLGHMISGFVDTSNDVRYGR